MLYFFSRKLIVNQPICGVISNFIGCIQLIYQEIPVKDIMVNAAGGFLGTAILVWLTLGREGIKALRNRNRRPVIEIKISRAPSNIFEAIEMGTSMEWVKQKLGHPQKIANTWWVYRFSDALVKIEFNSENAVTTVALGLIDESSTFYFPTIHFDPPPLGKMTIADVMVEHLQLEYVESRMAEELLVSGIEGPSELRRYITFGALYPLRPYLLSASEFVWDKESNRLTTPPEEVRVNWAAISSSYDTPHFPWYFGSNF